MYHQTDSSWTDFCCCLPGSLPSSVCVCVFVNVCMYVSCHALQCGEGPMQGYSPRLLSWEGEAGGCSGSLWQWSWGVCVCPGRRTPPPLPPPPHTPLWWTTPRKKWTSHASTRAHVKSKKVCCMCTVMGGASLMSARYHRCSFIFQRTWSCTTLYYHTLFPSIISCLWCGLWVILIAKFTELIR